MQFPTMRRVLLCALLALLPFAVTAQSTGADSATRFIVVLNDAADTDSVISTARTFDDTASVRHRSTLLPGHLWMTLGDHAASALRNDPRVARVVPDAAPELTTFMSGSAKRMGGNVMALAANPPPPLSDDPGAGKGVRVAIISTGVDYTHKVLGGDGKAATYAEALANDSAFWPGFPTDVVVGGLDVASEFGSIDPNPIEYSVAGVDMGAFPSVPAGRGTRLAGIVHALAPGADLVAYKVWYIKPTNDLRSLQSHYADSADIDRVFSHILDPNNDGDDTDRADIVLLDSVGGLAFYTPFEEHDSSDSVRVDFIQALAARGVLVVTDVGDLAAESRYGVSWDGAAPDALTVGAMENIDAKTFAAVTFSARGPVRGPLAPIKPDIVGRGVEIPVAIPGSGDGTQLESSTWTAAARIAAAAAILKSERPGLSALQLKAVLANTAMHDVRSSADAGASLADVPVVGMGRLNVSAAIHAGALIYGEGDYQPSVNFGFHELDDGEKFHRQLVIHNLDDADRVFTLSHEMTGENPANDALTLDYPVSVTVPAHHQVTLPLAIMVDPAKLPAWPLTATNDYTNAAWQAAQLSGYLVATGEADERLSVGWLITPRVAAKMRKHVETLEEIFDTPLKDGFSDSIYGLRQDFTNTGAADTSYIALAMMAERENPPVDLTRSYGHYLRHIAGGVFDEPACASGRKLVLGVTLHRPAEVAAANYFDKIGDPIIYFEIFKESTVARYGFDVSIGPGNASQVTDEEFINYGFVALDETGRPITVTTDLDKPFDITDPDGRFQRSILPTFMATNTRNVIAQMCTEDLFHHAFRDESELDRNLGFTIATDRDVLPTIDTPIIQFNPVKHGYLLDTGLQVVNLGAKVSLNRKDDGGAFSSMITLAPGETGTLTALKNGFCDSFGLVQVDCYRRFLLMGTNSDFVLAGDVLPGGASTIAYVKSGQVFSVSEDAGDGDIVGQLELDADGFFADGPEPDDPNRDFQVYQVNALPGNPFRVAHDGTIVVSNAAALDHETQAQFRVLARTKEGNDQSSAAEVMIRIGNVNDSAPVYEGGLDSLAMDVGDAIEIVLADHFSDPDGDALSYAAASLPADLAIDGNRLRGTVVAAGAYDIALVASDGVHETEITAALIVTGKPAINTFTSGGGGGGAFGFPLLLGMLVAIAARWRSFIETRIPATTAAKQYLSLPLLLVLSGVLLAPAPQAGNTEAPSFPVTHKSMSVQHDGKPLYFVHLEDAPLAIHARNNFSGSRAFSEHRLNINAVVSRQYTQALQAKQDLLTARIHGAAATVEVVDRFTLAVNALLVAIDESEVEAIRTLPGVRHVEKVVPSQLQTDRGPAHIGATRIWNGVAGLPGTKGEGVIVGIIDSGIRTDHPAFADIGDDGYDHVNPRGAGNYLGDCIANARLCNDKLIGVISYPEITDGYDGKRPADGFDYNGHGTHVASTAAGNVLSNVPAFNNIGGESDYRFPQISGVAPHANIVAYQVCLPDGSCLPFLAVKAIEHAIANGIDVLNYSIGGGTISPWEAANTLAFLSARAAGIHVASSAGNSGPDPSTITAPGNSPWITTVAAYTHDRDYAEPVLTEFTGGRTAPRGELAGKGVTSSYQGPVVSAARFDDPLCLEPFPRGTFRGEIVVCERGTNPRVEKGRNVKEGGAGGMILINTRNTDDMTFSDFNELPAIHLNMAAGSTVLTWLGSGTGHTAKITAAGPVISPQVADIAAGFSSRGPGLPSMNVPAPDVAAPGVEIFAAWIDDPAFAPGSMSGDFAFLSGTSMASPHVAGSLTLLASLHPDWSPAEAESALITTANDNTQSSDREASTVFDQGGGVLDVPAAAVAGLVMGETEENYLAANPATGGDPANLNMPILIQERCMLECRWVRTVKAASAGTWNATSTSGGNVSITVEPATFTLAAGEEQTLTITATIASDEGAEWEFGEVVLTPRHTGPTTLPVAVRFKAGRVPDFVTLSANSDSDSAPISGFQSIGTEALHIEARGLVKAGLHEAFLVQDPTPEKTFDNIDDSVQVVPLHLHSGTRAMIVEILEADAPDLDLYIGRDMNFDGQPTKAEWLQGGLCLSGFEHSMERCVLENPDPGVYWIVVQNFEASAPDALDRNLLSVATIEDGSNGLTVTGPASVGNGESYSLEAAWDIDMAPGDHYYAQIVIGSSAATPDNIGRSILRIDRAPDPLLVTVDQTEIAATGSVTYHWEIPGLPADAAEKHYLLETTIPEGMAATSDGGAEKNGTTLAWTFTQAPGTSAASGHVTVSPGTDEPFGEISLSFTLTIDGQPQSAIAAPKVTILPGPVARINGASTATMQAEPGHTLRIDATTSTPGREGGTLKYQWHRIAGQTGMPESAGGGLFDLSIPENSAGKTLKYELRVVSGDVTSQSAALTVKVRNSASVTPPANTGSGGGATGFGLLLLVACARKRKKT